MRKKLWALAAGIAAPMAKAAENPYGETNLVSMFDGKDLSSWTFSKAGLWSAKDGVIHGNGTARGWLYYNKQQAGTFRWLFTVRQVTGNHKPTVLIWGTTDPLRDALSAIQFQPPNGGHWDYRPGHNDGGGKLGHFKEWAQCELIGNQATGVARMACCPPTGTSLTCGDRSGPVHHHLSHLSPGVPMPRGGLFGRSRGIVKLLVHK